MHNRFGLYSKQYFSSQKEYDDYCWCLSKIELGDIISIYIHDKYNLSLYQTNKTVNATVIAINKSMPRQLVIGSKKALLSFWPVYDAPNHQHFAGKNLIKKIIDYPYAWAVRSIQDARIAKITKNNIDD